MAITASDASTIRLSIMAGRGQLPLDILEAAEANGFAVQYLSFVDRPDLEDTPYRRIEIAKPLDIVLAIRQFKASHICMAGGVDVSDKGREGFFKLLGAKKKPKRTSGDTGISKLGKALEFATGATLVGAHEIRPDLVAELGHIAGPKPHKNLIADGQFALESAIAAGALDLGQALVCSGQRVVAVEDISGTDDLLRRIAALRKNGLVGDGAASLVLAKAKKPRQPMFVDLPAIGPGTILNASAAGISGIFVQAGKSIIIERVQVGAAAKDKKITVYGCDADGE